MKRYLFPLLCLVALGTVLALASPGVAQERPEPFWLIGMSKTAEDLGGFPWTPTLKFTIRGKGSIGDFEQIALVHFTWVGEGPPFLGPGYYLVEELSRIYVLGDDGQRTGDVIYLEACGVQSHIGPGASGDFLITGGEGVYEGASGSGKMVRAYPGFYIGKIYTAPLLSGTDALAARGGSTGLECQVDPTDPDYGASAVAQISSVKSCYACTPEGSLFYGMLSVHCKDLTPGETYTVCDMRGGGVPFTASASGAGGAKGSVGWVGNQNGSFVGVVRSSDGSLILFGFVPWR